MAARSPFAFILAGSVGASLNGGCMSAGGIQASRSVPVTEDSFLFASHNQVYFTQVNTLCFRALRRIVSLFDGFSAIQIRRQRTMPVFLIKYRYFCIGSPTVALRFQL